MGMFVLDCGTMQFPRILIIQDEQAQKNPYEMVTVPLEAYLIESPEGYILFDTGCDPDGVKGNWPEDYRQIPFQQKYLPDALHEIGVKPEEIKYVVASHLHFDHAGCLHPFKQARIFVNQLEFDQTMHAYANQLDLNAHLASDIKNWNEAGLTWERVSPEQKTLRLADGVTIVNLGSGHAWGMLGLMVELESGNYFLVSDAIYTRANQGPPQKPPAVLSDPEGYHRTVEFIGDYAAKHHATVICGHDLEQFQVLLAKKYIK